MKEIQFLLLDAGPIIKLFELGIWESFIRKYDVTIARTVAEQAVFIGKDDDKEYIDFALAPWAQKGLIKIVDVALSAAKTFYDKFDPQYKDVIHEGEKETWPFCVILPKVINYVRQTELFFEFLVCWEKATKVFLWKKF